LTGKCIPVPIASKTLPWREALGEIGGALAPTAEHHELRLHQDPPREALAEALERLLDATDLAEIGPHARS